MSSAKLPPALFRILVAGSLLFLLIVLRQQWILAHSTSKQHHSTPQQWKHKTLQVKQMSQNTFCEDTVSPQRWKNFKAYQHHLDQLRSQSKRPLLYIALLMSQPADEVIMADLSLQLYRLVDFIGHQHLFVSIVALEDQGQQPMVEYLQHMLLHLKVEHQVELLSPSVQSAQFKNQALKYVWSHFQEHQEHMYDRILFLTPVFYCMEDMLDLLYQSMMHQLDITCGLDYDLPNSQQVTFKDIETTRDRKGNAFSLGGTTSDSISNGALHGLVPFQVSCCWYVPFADSLFSFCYDVKFLIPFSSRCGLYSI